jgi:hypothetical protein
MKHGCAIWGVYLGGCLAAATAVQYELDGIVLAYTAPSSPARNAVEWFLNSERHHRFKDVLGDRVDEAAGVEVKFVSKDRGKFYKVWRILKDTKVIYQAVDVPDEFWCIFREFGPGTEFICDDVLRSSVLEIDPPALCDFAREYVAPLHLGDPWNIEAMLFFGALMDHFHSESTLLGNALREIQAIAKMESDTPQWPREERQAIVERTTKWLGLEKDVLRRLDLTQLSQRSRERPVAPQENP